MTDNAIMTTSANSFIAPVVDVKTALMRYQAVKDFIGSVLKEGVDFGKVPGSDKPTLLKPGAEKMTAFFAFTVRFILTEQVEDWTGESHNGEPFFYYRYRAQLWRGENLVAEGDGSCNSWEKKYRYRQADRVCPECGQSTIFKSKQKPEFYCWQKKGGCGKTFPLSDKRITEQEVGQIKNPDPADIVNTLQKMAQKRALIAPVLIATNTSEYFTQDVEDFIPGTFTDVHPEPPQPGEPPSGNGHHPEPEPPDSASHPQSESKPKPSVQSIDPIYDAVIQAGLAQDIYDAKGALNKCKTGYDNPDKAIAWMRLYRGYRDSGLKPDEAAAKANAGEQP